MLNAGHAPPPVDFSQVFSALPSAYIVLSPDLTILAVSDAYLQTTMSQRATLIGHQLFAAFPENPADPATAGMQRIYASLDRVRREHVADIISLQRYDLHRPDSIGGGFEERYWSLISSPVIGSDQTLQYIIHRVEDMTEYVRLKQHEYAPDTAQDAWKTRTTILEAEIYGRAQEAQARQIAEAQRERLYSLFMQAPAPICVLRGPDLVYELANPLYRQLVGAERPLLGKPLLEALPEVAPELQAILRQVYTSGERFVGEEFPITLDWDYTGRLYEKFLNFVYEPLRDDHELVDGIMVFAYEVTDQVRARQRMALLAEASISLTSLLDPQATLRTVARLAVPSLADFCFFDIVRDDQLIERVAWAYHGAEQGSYLDDFDQQAYLIGATSYPVQHVLDTGVAEIVTGITDTWMQQHATSPRNLQIMRDIGFHSMLFVSVIGHDRMLGALTLGLTNPHRQYSADDRGLAEDLARRAALAVENAGLYAAAQHARTEAERAVRVRDEFLSIAAHELKTPVTSMRGYAQLLLNQLAKGQVPDAKRMQRALDAINQQSTKLTRFIEQLLDVSRIAAGRLDLHLEQIDIGALAQQIVAIMQPLTPQHILGLTVYGEHQATVDPLRLEQVLTNVITNAVKYSPAGGLVQIAVHQDTPPIVRISITDRGIGIPPEHREHIFERFYQAHSDGYFGGMGLGLSISQAIMQLHGGQIAAEFPEEGGTRIVLSLPTALAAAASETHA